MSSTFLYSMWLMRLDEVRKQLVWRTETTFFYFFMVLARADACMEWILNEWYRNISAEVVRNARMQIWHEWQANHVLCSARKHLCLDCVCGFPMFFACVGSWYVPCWSILYHFVTFDIRTYICWYYIYIIIFIYDIISIDTYIRTISYYILLYPTISYYILLHPTISYYILLYPTISYYILLYPTISHYILLSIS